MCYLIRGAMIWNVLISPDSRPQTRVLTAAITNVASCKNTEDNNAIYGHGGPVR